MKSGDFGSESCNILVDPLIFYPEEEFQRQANVKDLSLYYSEQKNCIYNMF